ncbi:hypothetical protein BT69DRAFT_1316222 [Atractiella rhizophila]|nr:hypothetical protein BT69DRAFT_1316222 [Atractiella rhizophila]
MCTSPLVRTYKDARCTEPALVIVQKPVGTFHRAPTSPQSSLVPKSNQIKHNVPVGRDTRYFRGFDPNGDLDEEQQVSLKDTWRNVGYAKAEGEIYELLKEKGVPHVLKPVAHSDVPGILQLASAGEKSLRRYRLVLDEVGCLLWECPSTKCFAQTLADALKVCKFSRQHQGRTHLAALDHQKYFDSSNGQVSILHRDVSILFYENGRGFLGGSGWELAKVGEDTSEVNERTGTEEFMSMRLFESIVPDHEVQDDMVWIKARKSVIGSERTVEHLELTTALAFKDVIEEVMTAIRQSILGFSRELLEAKWEKG